MPTGRTDEPTDGAMRPQTHSTRQQCPRPNAGTPKGGGLSPPLPHVFRGEKIDIVPTRVNVASIAVMGPRTARGRHGCEP